MAKIVSVKFLGDEKDLTRALGKAEADGDKFGKAFKVVGLAAAAGLAAVGTAAFKLGKDSVAAFMEAEAITAQFNNVVRQLPAALRPNVAALEDFNAKLSLKLALDDEEIVKAQTVALRYGATKDQLQLLTQASADLATVQGTDLSTSMENIIKAAEGSDRALKVLGLEGIKLTGDHATDLALVMDTLRTKTEGAAAAAAATSAGAWEGLKVQFGNVQETIGAKLVNDALPALVKGLGFGDGSASSLATALQGLSKQIEDAGPKIAAAFEKIGEGLRSAWEFGTKVYDLLVKIDKLGGTKADSGKDLKDLGSALFGNIPELFTGGKRAHGGPVVSGQSYLVGEQGPEMFVPGTSGSISPGGRGAGGGLTIVIQAPVYGVDNLTETIRQGLVRSGQLNVGAL